MIGRARRARRNISSGRVVVVSPYYEPEHSGSAPYVTEVARHLSLTHQVTVLTGVPHYPQWRVAPGYDRWRSVERTGDLEVRRLRHYVPTEQSVLRRAFYELSFALRVLGESLRLRADAVIVFTPPVLSSVTAAVVAAARRAPLGVVVHDLAGMGAKESGMRGGGQVAGLVAQLERWVLRRAAGIVVLHRQFTRHVAEEGDPRVRVIRNWSGHEKPRGDRASTRARLGWSDDTCVVVHSGNMGLKQGLENVVSAARLADDSQTDVRFVLMGDGSQRPALEQLARGVARLTFVAPVPGDQFLDVLQAADVLLVNERAGLSEMSVPSKLTAYFAAGRPVITASEPGSPASAEVAEAGAGERVDSGDPAALLDAIVRLHGDPARSEREGAAARAFADQEFAASAALDRYSVWVDELLRRRPR